MKKSSLPSRRQPLARSKKAIPKVNPRRQAKRKAGYRKMLSGKEYKVARAGAFERAGNRCEWNDSDGLLKWDGGPPFGVGDKTERDPFRNDPSRCEMTTDLEAHHLRYPKSRPVAVRDLVILCNWHHRQAESLKPHKSRMF